MLGLLAGAQQADQIGGIAGNQNFGGLQAQQLLGQLFQILRLGSEEFPSGDIGDR